jgi:thioredoxin-like negative regulator of GroEL
MSHEMKSILKKIKEIPALLLYCSTPECQVCRSLRPRVETLLQNYPAVHFHYLNINDYPLIRGQYLIFTVPTLILFIHGKELKRFGRFLSIDELKVSLERMILNL